MSETAKPVPSPNDANRAFWSGCAQGKLRLRRCTRCGTRHAPTRIACVCGSVALDWVDASGRGLVFSFNIVHRAPNPAFRADIPYVIAIVALEEGPRLMSNLVGCAPAALRVGLPVKAVFETLAQGVGLPKFEPA
jgi:uncharacterized OB-fold protein